MTQPVSPTANLAPVPDGPLTGASVPPADPRAQAFSAACATATGAPQTGAQRTAKQAPPAPAEAQPKTAQATSAQNGGAEGAAAPAEARQPQPAQTPRSSLDRMLQRPAPDGQKSATLEAAPPIQLAARASHAPAAAEPGKPIAKLPPASAAAEREAAKPKPASTPAIVVAQGSLKTASPQDPDPQAPHGPQADGPQHRHKTARHPAASSAPASPPPLMMPGLSQPPHPVPQADRLRVAPGTAAIAQITPHGAPAQGPAIAAAGPATATDAASATPENQAQLLQSATALAGAGGGAAKVTLHPASLGTVVVQVNVTPQGVTHVQMTAATEGGYQTLAAASGHLAQQLSHSGLNVGSVQAFVAGGPGAAGSAGAPQPGAAQPAPQTGTAAGGMAGGFAGSRQQAGGGQGQPQPQPQDLARDVAPAAVPRPRSGPDETVKAYA